jgi:hypothetical protein
MFHFVFRYQLVRINSRGLHKNCKWLQMFDDVRVVIFCVAASGFDEYYEDANGTIVNKMIEIKQPAFLKKNKAGVLPFIKIEEQHIFFLAGS